MAEDGTVIDWRAFAQANGMFSYIFLKDKTDRKLWQEVYDLLHKHAVEGVWGFEKIRTEADALNDYGLHSRRGSHLRPHSGRLPVSSGGTCVGGKFGINAIEITKEHQRIH